MFLWFHVRYINPVKIQPKRITRLLMILIMMELNFLFEKKILARLKKRAIFVLMCFVMKETDFSNLRFKLKI